MRSYVAQRGVYEYLNMKTAIIAIIIFTIICSIVFGYVISKIAKERIGGIKYDRFKIRRLF